MKIAYLDAFSGIAGDMTVGAFLDAGLELEPFAEAITRLELGPVRLRREPRMRNGIAATKFVVEIDEGAAGHGHRAYSDIRTMLEQGELPVRVRELSLAIFAKLAEAEGRVHGVSPDDVTFHEVGAIDSIVDVVGAAWGVAMHGIERVRVSTLPLGSGFVETAHGRLPVPGPATTALLSGFPVRPNDGAGELVTPTGAAIVAALAEPSVLPAEMSIEAVGYGAGDRELADRPNLLRVILGTLPGPSGIDRLVVLEANVDDLVPEIWEHVLERLFTAGARDVFLAHVQMKKGRPGTLVSVLCDPEKRDLLAGILFAETSTLGVRVSDVSRLRIERKSAEVETEYGTVRVKVARAPDGTPNVAPEYDDCRRLALERGVALKLVYQSAIARFRTP